MMRVKWQKTLSLLTSIGLIGIALFERDTVEAHPFASRASEQISAGAAAYEAHCAACHGPDLIGLEHSPNLKGDTFWKNWSGKSSRLFYSRIISTMPLSDPGSLEPKQALDIATYILSMNGQAIPAEGYEAADQLNNILLKKGE